MENTDQDTTREAPAVLNGIGAVAAAETLAHDVQETPAACRSGAHWVDTPRSCRVGASGQPLICISDADTASRAATAAGLAMAGLRSGGFEDLQPPEELCREMHRFAARGIPFVLNVAFPTGTDVFALIARPAADCRRSGAFLLHGRTPQQAADLALIAHRIAETGLVPGIHAMDATRVAERFGVVEMLDASRIRSYLGRPDERVSAATPAQRARFGDERRRIPDLVDTEASEEPDRGPDADLWKDGPLSLQELAGAAFEEFSGLTGRRVGPLEAIGVDGAELILVGTGPRMNDAVAVAEHLRRTRGLAVGVVNVTLLHPFPREALRSTLAGSASVVVIEEDVGDRPSSSTACPLFCDLVRAALGPEWLRGGPLLKGAPVWDERQSIGAVMLDAGDSAPRALLEALARSLPETITLPVDESRDDSAPADPPEAARRSLTIRIEAPDGWGESLAARVASTVCLLGTVDAIGGPATDARGARVGTTVELSTGAGRLDAAGAEADVLIVPTAGGLDASESLPPIARGGALVMQTPGGGSDAVWDRLSEEVRGYIESNELSVYGVDARHRQPSAAEDAIPLADAVSAVFEGAVFKATGALARLGIDADIWERTLAEDPLQAYRKHGADTVSRIEPVSPRPPEDGIVGEPDAVDARPRMPIGEKVGEEAARSFWLELDQFQRSGRGGGIGTSLHGTDLYPALLASYRDLADVRYAYPLWIAAPEATVPEPLVRSLGPLLEQAVNHHAPEESSARALKDNLLRLEQRVRDELDGCPEPRRFRPALESAIQAMLEELAIPGEEGQGLANDAAGMLAAMPENGWLIGYSSAAPLVLLRACLEAVHSVRLEAFRSEARTLRAQLRDLLKIEEAKAGPGKDPGRLTTAFGGIADILNPESVSEILPKRSASEAMTSRRLGRICHAEATLAAFEEAVALHGGLLLRPEALKSGADGAQASTPWILLPGADSCAALIGVFEGHMATMARWFAAAHVARLEIADSYDESTHDDYFATFDWRNFTDAELALAAPVVLVEEEERLGERRLQTLSRLLLSGRPVKVLVLHRRTEPHVAGFESGEDPCPQTGQPAFHFRRELDHLAVAHPEAFVLQSSPVDPEHLVDGYRRGLEGARPAIFRVFAPAPGPSRLEATSPFLKAGAALDGRDFPLFSYDPDRAATWSDRFDVSRNPEPGEDWPTCDLEALDVNGDPLSLRQAFTFADFAAQDPAFFGQIRHVPRPLWNDDMIPLDEYLSLPPGQTGQRVPYFWMVDAENVLQRVVPSHALVLACQDRLNHWHILQELGGIKNPHAERAAREAREEARVETEREIDTLRAEHAAELERVREATAREAMAKLADVLLDLDLDAAAAGSTARSPAAPSPAAPAKPPAESPPGETPPTEIADEDEDELVSDEPWLETFRCTSCNECIDINPMMFKYNADKLATITDPRAGTYAELVKAAEKCPARCIHPGKPLNPDEPGLDALMKRAEKFS